MIDTAQAARGDGLQVELGGQAIQQATQAPPGSSELIGIAAAAIILFLAFGSLLGMLLPLIVAIAGVGGGLIADRPALAHDQSRAASPRPWPR